jgi:hypothetical protein
MRGIVITGLGIGPIFAWSSSCYLPAVLAKPIVDDTGWVLPWVIGSLSLALFGGPGCAATVGRLAVPSLIAQAAAPSIGAALLSIYGVRATLATLMVIAIISFGIASTVFAHLRWSAICGSRLQKT